MRSGCRCAWAWRAALTVRRTRWATWRSAAGSERSPASGAVCGAGSRRSVHLVARWPLERLGLVDVAFPVPVALAAGAADGLLGEPLGRLARTALAHQAERRLLEAQGAPAGPGVEHVAAPCADQQPDHEDQA